ncbi:MAG: putative glucans biosynthesis protein, partial [Pseudomonadota bacterium]
MTELDRRTLLAGLAISAASLSGEASAQTPAPGGQGGQNRPAPPQSAFSYDEVVRRARDISAAPYDGAVQPLPEQLARLDFDAWREIRFRSDRSMLGGAGGKFRLQLFHLGHLFLKPVTINTVRDGLATPIPYTASLFDYGRAKFDKPLPVNMGFAGFRV